MEDYKSKYYAYEIDPLLDAAANALSRAGGTMTGQIALPSAPTEELDAANKGYVDKNYTIPVKQYGNTPFVIIDNERMQRNIALLGYKSDGSTNKYKDCSPVMRCPKILGINVYGDARVMLYIGDMVDGRFVLDSDYIFSTGGTGIYNHITPSVNRLIETDGGKWFYYRVDVDGEYEIIMGDEMPENGFEANAIVPFYSTNAGAFASSATYSSFVLPSGCYYAVIPGADVTADQRSRIHVSYHTEGTNILTVIPGGISFGHIPDNAGAALLRLPDGVSPDALRVYASKPVLSNANNAQASVIKEAAIDLAKKFSFVSQKAIAWDDSQRLIAQGKMFYGVPYSSRWKNSHHVGFEVSCETALNALADEYSIAYDGGKYYEGGAAKFYDAVSGHSEINQGGDTVPSGGGPGYGLVCSSFMCLINGNAYPQTNRGFTFDKGFEVQKRTDLNSGMWLSNEALSHCVFVDEIFDKGYSLYHGIQPCIGKTVQTSEIASNAAITTDTRLWRLNGYSYSIANRNKTDVNQRLMNLDVAVAGGNIRPWRGNKAVYGPWDKSTNGSGIGITIHNGAATARLTTPSGTVHSLSVSGKVYLDISSYVTEDGTYTLDSGAGTSAEYFRYFNHDDVTLTFDTDGRAVLTPDAEYVYVKVSGYGDGYSDVSTDSGPIVIAAGQAYPDLAADSNRILEVYAAIVADPTEDDCWGRYSCVCSKGTWKKPGAGTDVSYTLPTASKNTKGGVKIGNGLVMNGEVLSVTGDQLPNYVVKEATAVIDKIAAAQKSRTFTLAAITDLHYGNAGYTDGVIHATQALKYIDERIKLDAVAVLGDFTDGHTGREGEYENAINDFRAVNTVLNNLRFGANLRIHGNHDFYEGHMPEILRYTNAYSEDVVWGNTKGDYFYRDFTNHKLRIICLNMVSSDSSTAGYTDEQAQWFADTLDLTEKGDAANWHIVVLSHQPVDFWHETGYEHKMAPILRAYINGASYTSGGVSCNFAGKNAATIVGNIHGHIHNLLVDRIYVGDCSLGVQTDVLRIATPEACYGRANTYEDVWHEEVSYDKTQNTANDTSFVVYCIDLDSCTIEAICYGCGYDRTITYGENLSWEGKFDDDSGDSGGDDGGGDDGGEGEGGNDPVNYTNQILIATDENGNVVTDGVLYENKRWNSEGEAVDMDGFFITGFIPAKFGDLIRIRWDREATGHLGYCAIRAYNAQKEPLRVRVPVTDIANPETDIGALYTSIEGFRDNIAEGELDIVLTETYYIPSATEYVAFALPGDPGKAIVTINEPIE